MLILVIDVGGRQIELALPRPNAEIVIYGLTQGSRGPTAQHGHPDPSASAGN